MKKKLITGITFIAVLGSAGIAWAFINGTVTVPDVVAGLASGGGANSCQTNPITFILPDPTWDQTMGEYTVNAIGYSGIDTACINLGTADLTLTITASGQTVALSTGTATDIGTSAGTISIVQAVPFDVAANSDYNFLVSNS